jgi:hypothetical protein
VRKKNHAELRGRRRNVRKMAILVAVAALMVALVAGTAAAKGGGGMKTFNFKGTAVSEDGSSISVEVSDGNRRGWEAAEAHEQAHPGEPMVFAVVRDTTKVEIDDAPASVAEVAAVGGEVRVQSKAPEGSDTFVAGKVTVETDED